jgi:hypothetical protein
MRSAIRVLVFAVGSTALLATAGCSTSAEETASLRSEISAAQARADAAYELASQANAKADAAMSEAQAANAAAAAADQKAAAADAKAERIYQQSLQK